MEVGDVLGVVGKPFDKSDLIEFISQFSELSCERYWFLVNFVAGNSNKLKNLSLEGKISGEPSMCSHSWIWKFSILKMWKIKNVFTLGPTAQAILVWMKRE